MVNSLLNHFYKSIVCWFGTLAFILNYDIVRNKIDRDRNINIYYYYYYYSQFVVESSIPNSFSYTNNNTISSFSTIALFDTFNKHQPAIFFTNPSHI